MNKWMGDKEHANNALLKLRQQRCGIYPQCSAQCCCRCTCSPSGYETTLNAAPSNRMVAWRISVRPESALAAVPVAVLSSGHRPSQQSCLAPRWTCWSRCGVVNTFHRSCCCCFSEAPLLSTCLPQVTRTTYQYLLPFWFLTKRKLFVTLMKCKRRSLYTS